MKKSYQTFLALIVTLCLSSNSFSQRTEADYAKDWAEAVANYNKGNYSEAVAFFLISAASGIPEGAHAMGVAYHDGNAFPRNYELAFKYYECASEIGLFRSQVRLATYYLDGLGVQKNNEKAYFWLLLASSNQFPDANILEAVKTIRDSTEKKLSTSLRAKIQQEANRWKPKKKEQCYFK